MRSSFIVPSQRLRARKGCAWTKGYDFEKLRALVAQFAFTAHIRARGEEVRKIRQEAGFRARRWVVERTHSWFNRFRGLLVRWAKKAENSLAFLHLVCGIIAWRATGLLGQALTHFYV